MCDCGVFAVEVVEVPLLIGLVMEDGGKEVRRFFMVVVVVVVDEVVAILGIGCVSISGLCSRF